MQAVENIKYEYDPDPGPKGLSCRAHLQTTKPCWDSVPIGKRPCCGR